MSIFNVVVLEEPPIMNSLNTLSSISGITVEEELDIILDQLKSAVSPVIDLIEKESTSERAVLVIGAKELTVGGEYVGTQTFIDICGDYGILGEALYAELMSSIADKRPELFQLFREVIKTIENELEIDSNIPIDITPRVLR